MLNSITLPVEVRERIPHLDQYFGLWAMHAEQLVAQWQLASKLDLHLHLASPQAAAARAAASERGLDVRDGVAIVALRGTLMKQQSSLGSSTSTLQARRQIRDAAADPNVQGIFVICESPGGTVAGTQELGADIAAAGKQKPVWAYAEDLCCSAGYWAVSQASKVYANPAATIGSIGTYAAITDESARAAALGVKVHIVRAGAHKGAGHPGTPITDEQLAMMQERIDQLNDLFVAAVASGRGFKPEQARELADGRGHIAAQARKLGLIDGVQSLDQTFSQFVLFTRRSSKTMNTANAAVSTDLLATAAEIAPAPVAAAAPPAPAAPRAATAQEIKAACPGADGDWMFRQLEAGATLDQARNAWMSELTTRNQKLQADNAALAKAQTAPPAPAASKPLPGVQPTPASNASDLATELDGDPIAQWEESVSDLMDRRKLTKEKAVRELVSSQPELHAAYIAAYTKANAHKVQRTRKTAA